jgi:hypothetical protein
LQALLGGECKCKCVVCHGCSPLLAAGRAPSILHTNERGHPWRQRRKLI